MSDPQILIIEDEPTIAQVLADYLNEAGYTTLILNEGTNAVESIRSHTPQMVVLDLMLPGKDGLTICREVREFSDVPIIMVTARVDDIDRLLGLELGADDYVCKPFLPKEVVSRVRAILRRVGSPRPLYPEGQSKYRHISLDLERFTCTVSGQAVELTRVEFRLLNVLLSSPGRVFSRQQLMSLGYDNDRIVSDRTIDTHIKNLRKKVSGDAPDTECIHSIYGVGYKIE